MDLFEYRENFGTEGIKALATKAGTGAKYLEHLVLYRKRPSTDLAHRLIAASGGKLTLGKIMLSSVEMEAKRTAASYRRDSTAAERSLKRATEAQQRAAAAHAAAKALESAAAGAAVAA